MTKTEKISREIIYNKGLRLLGHREYSVWGLRKKLREKFPDNFAEISKIVTEFVDKDWLSDERFCEYIVREKTQHSGWGERKIILKLQEHKISEDMIHEKLVKYFPENMQIKKAQKLALEKEHHLNNESKKLTNYEKHQKIKNFLVSRGFSFEITQNAIDILTKKD